MGTAKSSSCLLATGPQCPRTLLEILQTCRCNIFDILQVVKPLHRTGSCSVFLCTLEDGAVCVVKTYQKLKLTSSELHQVIQEYQVHQQLTSQHVVPFWAALDDGPCLHIVMQYCEQSDLRSMLSSGPLSEACVRDQVVVPLLHALLELHEKGYVHRDLKPENVFMSGGSALLGDFNLVTGPSQTNNNSSSSLHRSHIHARAKALFRCSSDSSASLATSSGDCGPDSDTTASADSDSEMVSQSSLSSSRGCSDSTHEHACHAGGTPAYCAPEVVLAAFSSSSMSSAVGPQNDIWSLGILAAESLLGQHPCSDAAAPGAIMQNILSSQQLPLSQIPVSAACKDWLAAALAKDPRQRWNADKLLQHEWITQPLPAEAHTPQLQAAVAASPAGASGGFEDAWEECWHLPSKQQWQPQQQLRAHKPDQQDRAHDSDQLPAQQLRQQQQQPRGCVPPWVEDDWVVGLDRLSSQLSKANSSMQEHTDTQCRQQDGQECDTSLRQLHSLGITSWED